ncbi:MAG TPA: hypothetical protein PKE29_14760 [Phycisphaerales bacterium]|nr:hypothetical protein [Phycisphaerales bacterium]
MLITALSVDLGCRPAQAQVITGKPPGACGACVWDSGASDRLTAQTSIVSVYAGDMPTADDVYIQPHQIAHVSHITAILIGESIIPKARLRIYEDCNGLPSTLLFTHDTTNLTDTGQTYEGLRVYLADFTTPDLWLPGGSSGRTYWVSVSGVAATPTDRWYWASAGAGQIAGRPGLFKAPSAGVPNWTGVNELACGCTDFALRLEGDCCEVLWDAGAPMAPASGTLSMLGPGSVAARAADDFVVPPCDDATVCYLAATMYSNCLPLVGQFEIYPDSCSTPGTTPIGVVPFTRAVDLGYSVTIGGALLRAYRVEALGTNLVLPGGRTYWLAAVARAAGGLQQKSLFAWASDCSRCASRLSPAMSSGPAVAGPLALPWRVIDQSSGQARALQSTVGIKKRSGAPIIVPPPCPADINLDGRADIEDIFAYLNAWFAGCP